MKEMKEVKRKDVITHKSGDLVRDQSRGRLIDARCPRRTLSVIPSLIHFSSHIERQTRMVKQENGGWAEQGTIERRYERTGPFPIPISLLLPFENWIQRIRR